MTSADAAEAFADLDNVIAEMKERNAFHGNMFADVMDPEKARLILALEDVLAIHSPKENTWTNSRGVSTEYLTCVHCEALCHSFSGSNCDGVDGMYPCATRTAIKERLTK